MRLENYRSQNSPTVFTDEQGLFERDAENSYLVG